MSSYRKSQILFPVKIIARDGKVLHTPEVQRVTDADSIAFILRQKAPNCERRLWQKIEAMGFKHSYPLIGYILDFFHPGVRVCVEVDGQFHADPMRKAHDRKRDKALMAYGVKVFRFHSEQAYKEPDSVAMHIKNILTLNTPLV